MEEKSRRIPRFYLSAESFQDDSVTLGKSELHYLKNVLRCQPGDEFAVLDGEDRAWVCRLETQGRGSYLRDYPAVPPLPRRLRVGIALCKSSRFEDALEKLSEIGVEEVFPMLTERSRNKPPSANKLKRWTSIVQSASALAYRLRPLKLGSCQTLDQALETSETLFVCQPGGEEPRTQVLPASMTLLIGPEGGFSETELTKIGTDVRKLGLGPLNLRVETAAVVASSLLLNL